MPDDFLFAKRCPDAEEYPPAAITARVLSDISHAVLGFIAFPAKPLHQSPVEPDQLHLLILSRHAPTGRPFPHAKAFRFVGETALKKFFPATSAEEYRLTVVPLSVRISVPGVWGGQLGVIPCVEVTLGRFYDLRALLATPIPMPSKWAVTGVRVGKPSQLTIH
ncbi:hypothetical protein [Mesorhizobium xinjiangense]|uniref:hypothetical protein n=1 Tax=Mesorhizobium xinjiangense TaxID=2678685 RepID=UPI0012ECE8A2|nr:hypothetical protein [Mesorhizobium xinjiangense]